MTILEPCAEVWHSKDWQENVARAARVCYASKGGKRTDEEMCKMLWDSGHRSMFRHGTKYYHLNIGKDKARNKVADLLTLVPYVSIVEHDYNDFYFSTNIQFMKEKFEEDMEVRSISKSAICGDVLKHIERVTICLVTQISTSRELNRTSPNNIAEQSTRYVNFGKRGGIAICRPHWYNKINPVGRLFARCYWHLCEFAYNTALFFGLPAEDAREFLPLCAATKVVYTYSRDEWEHILDLRLRGTTGAPHPNAKEIAGIINGLINGED